MAEPDMACVSSRGSKRTKSTRLPFTPGLASCRTSPTEHLLAFSSCWPITLIVNHAQPAVHLEIASAKPPTPRTSDQSAGVSSILRQAFPATKSSAKALMKSAVEPCTVSFKTLAISTAPTTLLMATHASTATLPSAASPEMLPSRTIPADIHPNARKLPAELRQAVLAYAINDIFIDARETATRRQISVHRGFDDTDDEEITPAMAARSIKKPVIALAQATSASDLSPGLSQLHKGISAEIKTSQARRNKDRWVGVSRKERCERV